MAGKRQVPQGDVYTKNKGICRHFLALIFIVKQLTFARLFYAWDDSDWCRNIKNAGTRVTCPAKSKLFS